MANNLQYEPVTDAQGAAGLLSQIFSRDVTVAAAICGGCGREGPFAELLRYGGVMGCVLRCPGCDAILLRLTTTAYGVRFEMQGMRGVYFPSQVAGIPET